MAYRVVGNQKGEAWLMLHGGPGASCQPGMLQPLDLAKQWAVAPDQRGCGASRPRGEIARNTLQALVCDLEALRQKLGVERWNVLAGSWGTVVALAYVQRHPQRVDRLVLRGAFATSRRELAGLLQPGGKVVGRVGFEPRWPRAPGYGVPSVLVALRKVIQSGTGGVTVLRVVRRWNTLEMACAAVGMRRSLRHAVSSGDQVLATRIRRDVAGLGRGLRRALANKDLLRSRPVDRRLRDKYRVQAHYLLQRGFVRPGELDRAVHTASGAGVAIDWVHGQFDAVCPSRNSQAWAALETGGAERMRLTLTRSGHLGHEADTLQALRLAVRRNLGSLG
ncbi:hypothetical protein LPB72_12245 [Hydrogenophaga crassostreae]|uniref:Proline iminopeptidase n=2 Tax=Hydrogenophaga crassostreae TaxID=1763535 RepID=A0A162P778_9BURK|nr:hypothetical protein LPB072_13625 [Hydrogenophaga crassostreae]OAD42024.1 hypothetical protein LPB72_12245 [Hydrogenophaga crassostreae]